MVRNPNKKKGFFATLLRSSRQASAESVRTDLLHSMRDACFDESGFAVIDHGDQRFFAFGLMFRPVLMATDQTEGYAQAALAYLPVGSVVQSCVLSSPRVSGQLDAWRETRRECESDVCAHLTRARYDMLAGAAETWNTKGGEIRPRLRVHYLFAQVPVPVLASGTEADKQAWLLHSRQLCRDIQDMWRCAGLLNELMRREDYADLWVELLNMQMSPRERVQHSAGKGVHGTPSTCLMEGSTVGLDENRRLVLGGSSAPMTLAVLTVDHMAVARQYFMEYLLGNRFKDRDFLDCPYWAYTTIQIVDTSAALEDVTQRHRRLSASAPSRGDRDHAAQKDAEAFLLQLRKGYGAVRAYTGINLYAPADEVVRVVQEARARAAMAGCRLSEETLIVGPTFVASLPFQYTPAIDPPNGGLRRARLMTSLHGANMMFVQGTDAISQAGRGGVPLLSRQGNLAAFDPWSNPGSRSAFNFSVIGAAGTGKTVFALDVLTDTLARGGQAAILEQGDSYSRHVAALGGTTVTFDPEAPISVNPFSLVTGEHDLDDLLPALNTFIINLAFGSDNIDPSCISSRYWALAECAASEAVREAGSAASLETVIRQLAVRDEREAQMMAQRLSRFTDAEYSRWFDGPSVLRPLEQLTSYDFERVSLDESLRAVLVGAVLVHLKTEISRSANRTCRKLVLVDDAEELLRGVPQKTMEASTRIARRYNGAYGVIAQVPPAVCHPGMFAFHIMTRAHRRVIERLLQDGFLNEPEENLAHSLQAGMFIKDELGGTGIYHLVLDDVSRVALSTLPADAKKVRAAQDEGLSYLEALERCSGDELVLRSRPGSA